MTVEDKCKTLVNKLIDYEHIYDCLCARGCQPESYLSHTTTTLPKFSPKIFSLNHACSQNPQ